jgi:hypothetical protein
VSGIVEALIEIEAAGAALRLDGDRVKIRYQDEMQRQDLAEQVGLLRTRRVEVAELLRVRATIPEMPPGVRLIRWNLKQPPIAIEACAVVTDPSLFALRTLEQLRAVMVEPARWVGWTLPQLIDRLRQVGVDVSVNETGESSQLGHS